MRTCSVCGKENLRPRSNFCGEACYKIYEKQEHPDRVRDRQKKSNKIWREKNPNWNQDRKKKRMIILISAELSAQQAITYKKLGGTNWLRSLLDKYN